MFARASQITTTATTIKTRMKLEFLRFRIGNSLHEDWNKEKTCPIHPEKRGTYRPLRNPIGSARIAFVEAVPSHVFLGWNGQLFSDRPTSGHAQIYSLTVRL